MNKKLIRKMQTAAGGPLRYWDNVQSTAYKIPFIPEKRVKLTNAGLATGAVLSTNLLDSIADNAYATGLPIETALGLAVKESTLGNPTDDRSAWNLSSHIRKLFNNVYPGTVLHINKDEVIDPVALINYYKGDIDYGWRDLPNQYGELFSLPVKNQSVLKTGFEFYKQHPNKYNPGQKNHLQLVEKRGKEVMQSPEIQKWRREWNDSKVMIKRPEPYKFNTIIQSTAAPKFGKYTNGGILIEKQGGKMNILEFLKNGSGIHIKEKNKGSFTRWCGGNVTEECIRRGKNSSNPKIRKKATFALNARHFKHKEGGIIKALEGTKTNFFLKAGNWINNNKDLVSSLTNAGLGIVSNIKLNKAIDAQIEANEKLAEVNKQQAFMNNYKEALGMLSDRSDIVNRNKAWLIANSLNYSDDELLNKNLLLQQSKVGVLDSLGGLSTDILNVFSNNKKSSSNNPPSDSYFGNYVKTLFKNSGTFNFDGSFNTSLGAYKFENGKYLKINTSPLSNLKFNI